MFHKVRGVLWHHVLTHRRYKLLILSLTPKNPSKLPTRLTHALHHFLTPKNSIHKRFPFFDFRISAAIKLSEGPEDTFNWLTNWGTEFERRANLGGRGCNEKILWFPLHAAHLKVEDISAFKKSSVKGKTCSAKERSARQVASCWSDA